MWLCLRFPRLLLDQPLDPALRLSGPQALVSQHLVEEANREAQQSGVRPGQSLATARSLCPGLQCRSATPDQMQARLEQLALWAYRFTPEISLHLPDSLLLNISGSLKLFGGFNRLYRRLRAGFRKRRVPLACGLGHTPLAAHLLSYDPQPFDDLLTAEGHLDNKRVQQRLDRQASHRLPCDHRHREQLFTLGLETLGQVNTLPRSALSRRFDHHFSQMLDRLYGQQEDPRTFFQPPDVFCGERQFNGELTRSDELRFPAAGLLDDLGAFLRLKQWVCRELQWHFHYCDGQHSSLLMPVSHSHFDHRSLLALVLLQLEKQELPGPVDSLTLHCARFESVQQRSSDLFPQSSLFDHDRHARYLALIDTLRARLGENALHQAQLRSEHLPERALQRRSYNTRAKSDSVSTTSQRPLWLVEPPLRLKEAEGRPRWQGELELLQGPERIDNHWWQQRQTRDYYIACTQENALCWVFRDCLNSHWYLHGWFG